MLAVSQPMSVQQPGLVPFRRQGCQFDARTIRRQPPHQPMPVKAHAGILDTNRGVHSALAPYISSEELFLYQTQAEGRIALASRAMNAPCQDRERQDPRVAEAAKSRDRGVSIDTAPWGNGKESSISLRASSRRLCGVRRILLHLLAQKRTGSRSLLVASSRSHWWCSAKDESFAARRQRVAVALFDGFGGFAPGQAQVFTPDRQYALVVSRTRSRV